MKAFSILIIIFWAIIIAFPDFLSYLIWWFFVVLWVNLLVSIMVIESRSKSRTKADVYNPNWEKEVFNIFWYKIYKK